MPLVEAERRGTWKAAQSTWLSMSKDDAGNIQIGIIPASRQASPFWGRIGLIEDSRKRHQIPTIQTVMRYGLTAL